MPHAVPVLATERLELRPASIEDAPAIQAVFPCWDVVRYLGAAAVPWPYPEDGALAYLRDVALPGMEAGTSFTWTIRPRGDPGRLVGAVGLYDGPNDRGFWLVPEVRGRGCATEASDAVTRFWFAVLGRPVLRVPKAVVDAPSRRISVRQGMRVVAVEDRDDVCGRLPSEVWELTAEDWRARQG